MTQESTAKESIPKESVSKESVAKEFRATEWIERIRFDEKGLVPAVVQESRTGEVLMVAYMNREALERTLETGLTWFYSRSRQKLWQKGETSGNVQRVKRVVADCDFDTLLVEVEQAGTGACHTGERTCFHNVVRSGDTSTEPGAGHGTRPDLIDELYSVILGRKHNPVAGSYTSYLFEQGIDKILKKVGEETTEVLIAAKNQDPREFVAESADLIYHLLVAMAELGIEPGAVWAELGKRRGGGGSEDTPPGK